MIKKTLFGHTENGSPVEKYIFTNTNGFEVHLLSYGLIIQKILYPTKTKDKQDIVLGFDTLQEYIDDNYYIGCIVGRNANRISNGTILIDNNEVQLTQNESSKQLHGGFSGFNKKNWECHIKTVNGSQILYANYTSNDLEEGFPGTLKTTISFELKTDNTFEMSFNAITDKETIVNLTRHDYFNLKDGGKTTIKDHFIKINANKYTPTNSENIPTGAILNTKDTVLDFSDGATINSKLTAFPQDLPMGFDHNYAILKKKNELDVAAIAKDSSSNRQLKISTTQPGVQFYTAAYINNISGKNNVIYDPYHGLCLETQHFPDATKNTNFESTLIHPNAPYTQKLIYTFAI